MPAVHRRLRLEARGGRGAALEVVEHEQPDRRGQVTLLAIVVDLSDQFGKRHVTETRNLLHAVPECFFETDAGFVTCDHDGTFYDGRLHHASSPLIRC